MFARGYDGVIVREGDLDSSNRIVDIIVVMKPEAAKIIVD